MVSFCLGRLGGNTMQKYLMAVAPRAVLPACSAASRLPRAVGAGSHRAAS